MKFNLQLFLLLLLLYLCSCNETRKDVKSKKIFSETEIQEVLSKKDDINNYLFLDYWYNMDSLDFEIMSQHLVGNKQILDKIDESQEIQRYITLESKEDAGEHITIETEFDFIITPTFKDSKLKEISLVHHSGISGEAFTHNSLKANSHYAQARGFVDYYLDIMKEKYGKPKIYETENPVIRGSFDGQRSYMEYYRNGHWIEKNKYIQFKSNCSLTTGIRYDKENRIDFESASVYLIFSYTDTEYIRLLKSQNENEKLEEIESDKQFRESIKGVI